MKLKEINDKFWLRLHRKPAKKTAVYFALVGSWAIAGIILLFPVILLGAIISSGQSSIKAYLILLIITLIAGILIFIYYIVDKKQGYIDAIYNCYLQRRKEKMNKYGIIEGENKDDKS